MSQILVPEESVPESVHEEELNDENEIHNNSRLSRIRNIITVEPVLLLQMISMTGCVVHVQSLYIDVICLQEYNNITLCSNLTEYPDKQKHVDGIASLYGTYRGLIEAALAILFTLFLGAWTDKHGSKMPIVLTLIGYAMSTSIYLIFVHITITSPEILLIASVPITFTGSYVAFLMASFRHIVQITTEDNRSLRIGIAEICWLLGLPIGFLGSAQLLKIGGRQLVFLIATILNGLASAWAAFWVKGEKRLIPSGDSYENINILKDMFDVGSLRDTISTCVRRRQGKERFWILLLLTIIWIRVLVLKGIISIEFLYTRTKLHWDDDTYSLFVTCDGFILIIGTSLVVLLLMKFFKTNDAKIGIFSTFSYLGATIIFMLADSSWMMYLGSALQMFRGLISIIVRSMLSKLVSKDELGKMFSAIGAGEAIMPLIATPLYNILFIETLTSFPGAVYLMSLIFLGFLTVSFIYLLIVPKQTTIPHSQLENENLE